MNHQEPSYVRLYQTGELAQRARDARAGLEHCMGCPRLCGVNRLRGSRGACHTAEQAMVYSSGPHFGEEAPLVGQRGSGTIFFSWCNMRCRFCINGELSHEGQGSEVTPAGLASLMIELQESGCHNINFVSPSHVVAAILEALPIAVEAGLRLPLVYNTGGYDRAETLNLLEGVIDIYWFDSC